MLRLAQLCRVQGADLGDVNGRAECADGAVLAVRPLLWITTPVARVGLEVVHATQALATPLVPRDPR